MTIFVYVLKNSISMKKKKPVKRIKCLDCGEKKIRETSNLCYACYIASFAKEIAKCKMCKNDRTN